MTVPDHPDWAEACAPDAALIERLALEAVATLPAPFRAGARAVVLRIEDFPPDALLRELEVDDPFDLTGLYDGIPLTEKSVLDQPQQPDMIWLFRRAILDEWAARGDIGLGDLVRHVLVHELAHHFGGSDGDIASVDRWWE